jgi:hypothetical protein
MKDRNGKYIHDISDEAHEAGRDNHTQQDELKNETAKANFNKNGRGNGWIAPELDINFDKKTKSEKIKDGRERRANDKKEEGEEGEEENKEEKEESKESDNKEEEKKEGIPV